MTPEFARLVTPIFLRVLDLEATLRQGRPVDLDAERDRIRAEFAEADLEAQSDGSPVKIDDFRLARRALVYWADEVLVFVEPRWREMTLEFESYQEQLRAVRFYEFGHREARHAHPDVVEVWFLAMALGFQGDILSAFRYQLGEDPPGATDDAARSRAAWAAELYRSERFSPVTRGPDPRPVASNVPILRGAGFCRLALQLIALVSLLAFGLFLYDRFSHEF